MLAADAFGNFRQLMQDVTLHPAMGVYLSMLGNRKPDAARNIRPDENYARELMQLFTIGLVQLERGRPLHDRRAGQPIPTYDQSVVEGFANVFTGWTYAGATQLRDRQAHERQPDRADAGLSGTALGVAKRLLDYPGAAKPMLPAGQTPAQDLADALDNLFNHPNVGPVHRASS